MLKTAHTRLCRPLPVAISGLYFLHMARDTRLEDLTTIVNSVKQKSEHSDENLKKLDGKIGQIETDIKGLIADVAKIKGYGAALMIVLSLLGIVGFGAFLVSLNNSINLHGQRIAGLEKDVENIRDDVKEIKELFRGESLKRISLAGKDQLRNALPEVQSLVSQIKKKQVALPSETVRSIGERLIEVAQDKTDIEAAKSSWQYAIELASYRSTLNPPDAAKIHPIQPNLVKCA